MKVYGFQKLTLLDYPEKVACTVFTGGCNFRCPFCQNGNLVLRPEGEIRIPTEEVLAFLKKRRGILEGVCVTGGEPTLQFDLMGFLTDVKELGYSTKLDTNGYRPGILRQLVEEGLVDYVAMDLKNAPDRYARTCGIREEDFYLENILESAAYLMEEKVDYEFRTTVMKELHDAESFEKIGTWIAGAKNYYLQAYRDSEAILQKMEGQSPSFSSYTLEELKYFEQLLTHYGIRRVGIRGIS